VTLLYTAALAGRLALLPQLLTRIHQERAAIDGIPLLVDLGRSCASDVWICEATGGRGMLVAMDAMGYDAFHIGPEDMLYTQPALVQQLRTVIQTPLAAGPWKAVVQRSERVFVFAATDNVADQAADLVVTLRLSSTPQVKLGWRESHRTLFFDPGWFSSEPLLGRLDLVLLPEPPYIEMLNQAQLALPPDLRPDPTMTGVVEFVQSEARYAERKRGQM
jgi:hypothetical protein